jgi:O-antigen ligase
VERVTRASDPDRARARAASAPVLRGALGGIVATLVLLGHTPDMLPYMYASLAVFIAVYLAARSAALLGAATMYLTSPILRVRWLFLAWAAASLLWSSHQGHTELTYLVSLLEIHTMGFVFYDACRNLGELRWILAATAASATAGAAHALATGLEADVMRLQGVFGNPNVFAITSLLGVAALLSGVDLGRRAIGYVLSLTSFLVLCAGVVGSTSRKGVLGVPILCLVASLVPAVRRRGLVASGAVAAALLVVSRSGGALHRFWSLSVERIAAVGYWMAAVGSVDGSLVERGRFLNKGVALFSESPWVGRGLDSFYWLSGEAAYAHSNYVEIGVALGLIGLVLYYGFHAVLLRASLEGSVRRGLGARFAVMLVILMLALDAALVSYLMKLPTLLMIACVGWLEGARDHE